MDKTDKAQQKASNDTESADQGHSQRRERLWSPMFVIIIGLTLCCFVTGQGLNSGTSIYIDRCGGTAAYAGLLAAVFSVGAAIVRLVSGPIIDKRGRRIVIIAGTIILVIGTLGPVFTHDTIPFTVFRLLQGAGFSAATTAAATAAADVLPASRLGEGIGYYGLGQAIAMSIGPALAIFLVSTNPAENLYIGLGVASSIAFVLALLCRYESHPRTLPETASYRMRSEHAASADNEASCGKQEKPDRKSSIVSQIFEKRALPGTIPMLIISPAFGFGIFFVGLYGTTIGIENAGFFYTVSAVMMIVIRITSASLMDCVKPIKLFAVAVLFGILSYLTLLGCSTAFAQSSIRDFVFYGAGLFYGICIGISLPLNQSVAVKNTPSERWGAANALFQLANDVGIGLSCVIWGFINDSFGFTTTLVCVAVCIALSFVFALICYPKERLETL